MALDAPCRDTVALGPLGQSLGFVLRLAQLTAYDDFFAVTDSLRFKPGEFSVLWVISLNPGIRQSQLGQRLMIKRAHMTKLIRQLEQRGLLTRRIPDSDRRAIELTLTPAGQSAAKAVSSVLFAGEPKPEGGLSDSERKTLLALLQKYVGLPAA